MAAVTERDLRQAVRRWFLDAAASGGLTDAQVIYGDDEGLRPTPPFAEIRVLIYRNALDGRSETFVVGTPAMRYVRSQYRDTVSINVYGQGAQEWLARAVDFLYQDTVRELLTARGFTIEPLGGMQNLSMLLDDRTERRFQQDFEVSYATLSDGEAVVEAEHVVVDATEVGPGTTFTVDKP